MNMQFLHDFLQSYLPAILYAVLTAAASFLGVQIKKVYDRVTADETKRKVVATCVAAVEQLYRDLDGETKKLKAIEGITEMLRERGVTVSQLELEMLLEAAVAACKGKHTTSDA